MITKKGFPNNDQLTWRARAIHQPDAPIVRVSNLSVRYENGAALQDINFELQTGERLAVVGPNGAGKSTLFKVIAGVLKATQGEVEIFGEEPGGHICIAYIPQRSQVDWNFPVSVADVVMMGRIGKLGLFRFPSARDWQLVRTALETVGIAALADRQIGQLSGGQQQRMFIARALAQEAELMLMDEPLTGLDLSSQEDTFQVLDRLREKRVTVLVALHDLEIAAKYFDRVMLLNHRMLGLGDPQAVLNTSNLLEAYGAHLHLIDSEGGMLAMDDTCCDGEE